MTGRVSILQRAEDLEGKRLYHGHSSQNLAQFHLHENLRLLVRLSQHNMNKLEPIDPELALNRTSLVTAMALVVVAKLVVAVAPPTGPPARHRQDDCCSPFRDASNGSQKVWASCKSDTLFLHRRHHLHLG